MDTADTGRWRPCPARPVAFAAASTASTISAAAHRASLRSGISTAPAWPPSPRQLHAQRCRGRDGRDGADGHLLALQERPLLDVQLDEGGVMAGRQAHVGERTAASRHAPHLVERHAVGILERSRGVAAESEPLRSRLPRQPMPNRVGSSLVNMSSSIGSPRPPPGSLAATGSLPGRRARRRCRHNGPRTGWRRCASRCRPRAGPARCRPSARRDCPPRSSRTVRPASANSAFEKCPRLRSGS